MPGGIIAIGKAGGAAQIPQFFPVIEKSTGFPGGSQLLAQPVYRTDLRNLGIGKNAMAIRRNTVEKRHMTGERNGGINGIRFQGIASQLQQPLPVRMAAGG